jgi:hypothetical protein
MLKLIKIDDNQYSWVYNTNTLFTGSRIEIIAYGYWNYGFEKDQMDKISKSLTKNENTFEFIQGKK